MKLLPFLMYIHFHFNTHSLSYPLFHWEKNRKKKTVINETSPISHVYISISIHIHCHIHYFIGKKIGKKKQLSMKLLPFLMYTHIHRHIHYFIGKKYEKKNKYAWYSMFALKCLDTLD